MTIHKIQASKKTSGNLVKAAAILVMALTLTTLTISASAFADGPQFAQDQASQAPAGAASTQAGTAGATAPASGPSTLMSMLPMLLIFGAMYFFLLRPQQKRVKEQQSMISTLKHGDEVVTSSGLLGKITGITDKVITLELDTNVRVKMLKSQVQQVVKGQIKDLVQ